MAFGPGISLISGNPITAALGVFIQLIGLRQEKIVHDLIRKLQKMTSQFHSMGQAGLFGSQVQRRKVRDRSLWQEIGYAEPADVPHLFARAPAGTSFTVKDANYPDNDWTSVWKVRRETDWAGDLRFPDGMWWGSFWKVDAGDPIDTVPPIGRDGVHRHDFPAAALARAMDSQPKQFLGPRPLAGEDAAARRAAFELGGGSAANAWFMYLDEQAKREGRRVRAWGGRGWLNSDPAGEALDERTSKAFRFSGWNARLWTAFSLRDSRSRGAKELVDQALESLGFEDVFGRGIGVAGRLGRTPGPRAFEAGRVTNLTEEAARGLASLGIHDRADFARIPQILEAT